MKFLYRLFHWLFLEPLPNPDCKHDWHCCNAEDMPAVTAETVRFICRRCGKIEGLYGRSRND